MTDFSINTHHAYLNTDVVIRNNTEKPIIVQDSTTSEEWTISDKAVVHLSAGTHNLVSGKTKATITIEDAVKFGGSSVKKAFVFDDNPWAFITMKDRLYAINIETGEEKVEHTITPDSIESFGQYYGKTCECFLFKTKENYSIYNVETGKIIITFSNHIHSNDHLIIYSTAKGIIVYDYRLGEIITEFDGQYSFGSKFYFVKEEKLYGLNLNSSHINQIDGVGKIAKDDVLYSNYLIKFVFNRLDSKRYTLFFLGNNKIAIVSFVFPCHVESWVGSLSNNFSKLKKDLDIYTKEKTPECNICNVRSHILSIQISNIECKSNNDKYTFKLIGEIVPYPSIGLNIPFVLTGVENSSIRFKDAVIESVDAEAMVEKSHELGNNTFKLPPKEKLLGKSSSGNLVISISDDGHLMYRNVKDDTQKNILSDFFDSSHYINAYFTSDGKNAIFVSHNKEFSIVGFEDLSFDKYDIEGMTVAQQAGINGYKPEIEITDLSKPIPQNSNGWLQDTDIKIIQLRKPVWRDPISLTKVKQEELSSHIFMSSDGTYSAENDYKDIYRNRITNQDITSEEYIILRRKYDFNGEDSDADKKKKIFQRKLLLEENGKERLFSHIIDRCIQLNSDIPEYKIDVDTEIGRYINENECFTPLFLDRLGYVIYQDTNTHKEKRILIGRSVYFLNYVSFSYDSRYLAFGAKMKRDDFRNSEDGVFVLYDLQEEKEIIRREHGDGLYAVWMTMFSKDGNVAYYDSRADAYIVTKESDYKVIHKIEGKSLLCFSPSGKYIAFSDQNYIDYTHHPNSNWGHQPSGNVFIYAVKDVQKCIEQYNDLGNGIVGVASRAGSVASAAFSCDEKRLMVVGDDGVVVVRNLHLQNNLNKTNSSFSEREDGLYHYGTHYDEYAGTYMGYSDDAINDAFDGDPDAYWNID